MTQTDEVYIEKVGDTLIIKSKKENRWEKLFMLLDEVNTSDFMKERVQPPLDDKELF